MGELRFSPITERKPMTLRAERGSSGEWIALRRNPASAATHAEKEQSDCAPICGVMRGGLACENGDVMLVKDELEGSSESETGPLGLLTATGFMPTTDRERAQRVADRIEAARARLARRRLERMDNASLDAVVDAILAIDDRSVGGRSLIADLAAKTVPVPEDGRADVVEIVVVTRHASLITDKTPQG